MYLVDNRAKLPDGLSGDYFVLQLTFWRIEHVSICNKYSAK